MATLKQRLHRKNSSGTYDTIHLETGADCITGTLGIANGGTGATTAANARTSLGITPANIGAAASSHDHSAANITSGTLGVDRGGTGRATLTSGYFLRGNGTGAVTMSSIDQVKEALGITASNPVIVTTGTIDYLLRYDRDYGTIESVTLTACDYIVITNTHNTSYPQVTIAKGGSGRVAVYFPYVDSDEMITAANLNSAGTTLSFNGIGPHMAQNNVTLYATYVTYKYK